MKNRNQGCASGGVWTRRHWLKLMDDDGLATLSMAFMHRCRELGMGWVTWYPHTHGSVQGWCNTPWPADFLEKILMDAYGRRPVSGTWQELYQQLAQNREVAYLPPLLKMNADTSCPYMPEK
jgi:hypothetical protein